MLKRFLVVLILWYQRVAPDRIRNSCRFEPSCSNYMILSIGKYGIKGVWFGLSRLAKCRPPYGGVDYP